MIKEIANDIVYVSGLKQSAIYNFKDGKVYSLNPQATNIISKYMLDEFLDEYDEEFLNQIKSVFKLSVISKNDYIFPTRSDKRLKFAWLELTQACGNRCLHCYEGEEHIEAANPLSYNEWKQVINDIAKLGCKQIQFIGGEPTRYKGLPGLLNHARRVGIKNITVFSNLYEISEELLATMKINNVQVHFSIYGSNAKIHDNITQCKGSFDRLINNIKRLKKTGIKCDAHIVVMKENEEDYSNIYLLLNQLKIKQIKCDEVRKVYAGCQGKHMVSKSRKTRTSPNFSCSKTYFDSSYYHNTCWYGKCVVSTDGTVYPCEFERNIKYGNVKENSLVEIIQNDSVDKFWFWDFSKVDICKDCEFRFACRDCRPLAFAENGNLTDKMPRCTYNPTEGTW